MSKLQAICLSALFLFAATTSAKTLYVDGTSGNDATTYESNSATSPWRTIGRAAWGSTSYSSPNPSQAAKPGDVVQIAAGIYWEKGASNGGRFTVSLNPANSGTAAAPITFRGNGMVYVRLQAGYRGAMVGCADNRTHIIWDNLQIDDYYGGSTSDTGPVVFALGGSHCQIINSDIKGHPGSYYHGYPTFGGNYRGITLEWGHNNVIRNNRIHNFRGGQNEAGVMAYDSNDNIIENNEFVGNGCAVFIKGVHGTSQARTIIRKNVVRDNVSGIRVLGSSDAQIYQNIVYNNQDIGLWAGFADSTRSRFVNNTVYNNDRGWVPQGSALVDVLFFGNVVVGNRNAYYNWDVSNPSQQDVSYDRNLYFQNDRHATFEGGPGLTFSAWRSTYGLDRNGAEADPRFVSPATGNFRLQPDSAARSLSVDILDLNRNGSTTDTIPAGAYVTGDEVIGRTTGPLSAAPSPPSDVVAD